MAAELARHLRITPHPIQPGDRVTWRPGAVEAMALWGWVCDPSEYLRRAGRAAELLAGGVVVEWDDGAVSCVDPLNLRLCPTVWRVA